MKVNIATIVPIHNGLDSTKKMLISYYESLGNSSLIDRCTLFIIDDGSTDGSREWISEKYPEIKMLIGDGNLWWSGSVNLGLKRIMAMYYTHFLLFNNDNTLDKGFFCGLHDAINNLGTDKIISSTVINTYPENHIGYCGVTFRRETAEYINNRDAGKRAIVNTAGGMGVLIPISVVHKIGLFDAENFPQKSGDTDFFLRAAKSGIFIHYDPNLLVYNDNKISGFYDNYSIRGVMKAYSFPKGYMNLKVDLKLFLKHGNPFMGLYRIVKKNVIFLAIGIIRIIKTYLRNINLVF